MAVKAVWPAVRTAGFFALFCGMRRIIMGTKAVRGTVVYWDLAALWNFALDYLLLLGTLRIAGRPLRRWRLALGAALGAAYSVAALALPLPAWTMPAALLVMTLAAFGRTERYVKLTLLYLLLACGLGGIVLLLGRADGMERLAYGLIYARLPWGVFFAASGLAYLLLTLVFRAGARHGGGEFVRVRVEHGGRQVTLQLLRDTGNTLSDPLTGEGVPVIEKSALLPLLSGEEGGESARITVTALRVRTVSGADGTLDAFRCDGLFADGRALGARLIALSPEAFGGRYQGLWFDDEREEAKRHELEKAVG